MEQVRNALLHRNGVADARLLDALYELDATIGEEVKVVVEAVLRYSRAVTAYGMTIAQRLRVVYEGAAQAEPVTFTDEGLEAEEFPDDDGGEGPENQ